MNKILATAIIVGSFLALRAPAAGGSQPAFTRPAMMEAMARDQIAVRIKALADGAAKLSAASQELVEHPGADTLAGTQKAWTNLLASAKGSEILFVGPVRDATFWAAAFYKQAYPTAVENVIRSSRELNPEFVELMGASAKGFYVIEYLLFDLKEGPENKPGSTTQTSAPRMQTKLLLEGPTSERRRLYVRELVRDLERLMNEVAKEAGDAGYAKKFAAAGQDSINMMVNQLFAVMETGVIKPMTNQLDQQRSGILRYGQIDGVGSSTSLLRIQALMSGVEEYYRGGKGLGLDDYARHVNPGLADRLDEQFKKTQQALGKIKLPLEKALVEEQAEIESFLNESKALELLFKVDLVSALGVTIMFNASDGD